MEGAATRFQQDGESGLLPTPCRRPPSLRRRCGEAASCTTVTAAPVSTGRAPRSCCWLCCCCWAVMGASQLAGGRLLPTPSYHGARACPSAASAEPAVPPRTSQGSWVLPLSCPIAGTRAVQGSCPLAARWQNQNETVFRRGWVGGVWSPGPRVGWAGASSPHPFLPATGWSW